MVDLYHCSKIDKKVMNLPGYAAFCEPWNPTLRIICLVCLNLIIKQGGGSVLRSSFKIFYIM